MFSGRCHTGPLLRPVGHLLRLARGEGTAYGSFKTNPWACVNAIVKCTIGSSHIF